MKIIWLFLPALFVAVMGSSASADDLFHAATKVADCEWAAADKYDDGHSSLAALAQRVIGICTRERFAMRRAAGFSPMDPSLDVDELQQAIENVENARKHRRNSN